MTAGPDGPDGPDRPAFPAAAVLESVGGRGNVTALGHCMVRLRFTLADPDLADETALRALPDVLIVVRQSGQLQLALRVPVTTAYAAVRALLDDAPTTEGDRHGE